LSSNYVAGVAFRKEVLLHLHRQGLAGAVDPFEDKRLSEILDDLPLSDIGGLGPWVIDVRNRRTLNFSEALSSAQRTAQLVGSEWAASIVNRRTYPVGESYVVQSLDQFIRLVCNEAPALQDARQSG
jgi:hypothetical protein